MDQVQNNIFRRNAQPGILTFYKIHLANAGWMWYYNDRRDTDERCLPLNLGNYSVALGEERDGVISCFYRKLQSLVVLQNEDNKCNGIDDHQCKCKQVFISNHFTTPFAETLGLLRGGRLHPP